MAVTSSTTRRKSLAAPLFFLFFLSAGPGVFAQQPLVSKSDLAAAHDVMGYATVVAGLATGIMNPSVVGRNTHAALGITAASMAATTMVLGVIGHWGEWGGDFSPTVSNVHALLGAAGGTMMIIAPFLAPSKAHALVGELGALTMAAGVVWTWVY